MHDWTLDRAIEENRRAREATGKAWYDPTLPLAQWCALQQLAELERGFAAGATCAVLDAISVCARHDLVMPEWVSRAYLERYHAIASYRADSWDAVFGRPHRKGLHLEKARRRRYLRIMAHLRFFEILNSKHGTTIDDLFFEEIGAELGIGKTLCKEFYYAWKNTLPRKI